MSVEYFLWGRESVSHERRVLPVGERALAMSVEYFLWGRER